MSINNIFYDDLYKGVYTYYDDSFIKTMVFISKNTGDDNMIKRFILLLFRPDRNDNDSLMHVNYKTILGFIIITGNFHYLSKHMFECNLRTFPSIFVQRLLNKLFTEKNIDIYREYFCENYKKIKVPTKINCKVKNVVEDDDIMPDDIITDDMSEKKIKKLRNKIKQEKNAIENNKNKIKTEIKDKISEFIHLIKINDVQITNNIVNYYVLCILKSYLKDKYNLNFVFTEKENELNNMNEKINRFWYYKFTDYNYKFTDSGNFKVLPYLTSFSHNFGPIEKTFSTCGETTLLNLLNYCLIQPDSTFDTSKIKNNDIVEFYRTKNMDYMYKNLRFVMHEWLDIISTINENGIKIYNPAGDIHNNINNIAYILNKIIYDKEEIVRENQNEFIVKAIKYMKQKTLCVIQRSDSNSVIMDLDERYRLFFYPGHGEMKNIEFTPTEGDNYLKLIDLNIYEEYCDFNIIYTLINNINNHISRDYNTAVSSLILEYFSKKIIPKKMYEAGPENIIYIFLSSIKIYQESLKNVSDYEDNEDESDYEDDEDVFKKRDPKYDRKYKMSNILLQNLPNLSELHLLYSYTDEFFENLSIYCKQLKMLEINWAKIDLDMKFISKNTNLESFFIYEPRSKVKIINLEYLNNLANLKHLYLSIEDLKLPDLYLPELLNLELYDLDNITTLGNLVFPKLIECTLYGLNYEHNKIEDISFLKNSKHLKKLNLAGMLNIKDYSFLNDLEELEELKMSTPKNITLKKITPRLEDLLEKSKITYIIIPKSTRSHKSNRVTSRSSSSKTNRVTSRSSPKNKTTSRSSPKNKTTSRSSSKTRTTSRSSPKNKTTSRSSSETRTI